MMKAENGEGQGQAKELPDLLATMRSWRESIALLTP